MDFVSILLIFASKRMENWIRSKIQVRLFDIFHEGLEKILEGNNLVVAYKK